MLNEYEEIIILELSFLFECGNDYLGDDGYQMVTKKWLYFGMITFKPYLRNDYLGNYCCNLGNDHLENEYFEMITKKWLLIAYHIWNDYLGTDYLKWLRVDYHYEWYTNLGMMLPTFELEMITYKSSEW